MTAQKRKSFAALSILLMALFCLLAFVLMLLGLVLLGRSEHEVLSISLFIALLLLPLLGIQFGRRAVSSGTSRKLEMSGSSDLEALGAKEEEALEKLKSFCREIESNKRVISSSSELVEEVKNCIRLVASHYHPTSPNPELQAAFAEMLASFEQTSRELRLFTETNVPFHNTLTVRDLLRAKKTFEAAKSLLYLYQGASSFSNPSGKMLRSLAGVLPSKFISHTARSSLNQLLAEMFGILGQNCIALYSRNNQGESLAKAIPLEKAKEELVQFSESHALRTLVLGQDGAGKSSIVNALFAEELLETSNVPAEGKRREIKHHLNDLGELHIIEAPGYQEAGTEEKAFQAVSDLLPSTDLIILVVPALSAARRADTLLIKRLRQYFLASSRNIPLIVCMTKIDALRPFRSWSPPYNLLSPESHQEEEKRVKAENIRRMIETAALDLQLPTELLVPVCTREHPFTYNLDVLSALIQESLPQAKQAMLRRLFTRFLEEDELRRFEESLKRTGLLLVRHGVRTVLQTASRLSPS